MNIKLGFSTCPNDTFIFDALVHGKVDTEGLVFDYFMGDVEELNRSAFDITVDMTKLSYHAYAHVWEQYQLLDSGSALGFGNGPLLIAKENTEITASTRVAIPGKYTTANLLLQIAFPMIRDVKEMLFSDIENTVLEKNVDAGLIIHENRFTYTNRGLVKLADLGQLWEERTKLPIPLGGIVVKRSMNNDVKEAIQRVLHRSILFAMQHPEEPLAFMTQYAQEMDPQVMRKHVGLYVNDFSVTLGAEGKKAVGQLYQEAFNIGLLKKLPENIFVGE